MMGKVGNGVDDCEYFSTVGIKENGRCSIESNKFKKDSVNKLEHPLKILLSCVREVCLLMKKPLSANNYWKNWNQLHKKLSHKFRENKQAIDLALNSTPRGSSLVENLNSRLRNYLHLRKHLGFDYLELLRFFLNHRTFMASRKSERRGKSPTELMTGENHPHWLEMLGFDLFQLA